MIYAHRAAAILHDVVREHDGVWLIPVNVCPIVPQTLQTADRPFEFVDIDPITLEPSREQIRMRASSCAGVVFVRTYGAIYEADSFFAELKTREDFTIVDDRCLCRPDIDGENLSPHADATLFSTGYAKYVDLGGGGFATVANKQSSRPPDYRESVLRERTRADELKARLNMIYREIIPRHVQLPPELCTWRFNIRVPRSEDLVRKLLEAGLFASRHYAPLVSGFPHAEALHAQIVNLFNDRYFNEEKAARAAELVRSHVTR